MLWNKKSLSLYLVTPSAEDEEDFLYKTEEALKGGVTFLQFRDKALDDCRFVDLALKVKALCKKYNVPFVINDRVALWDKIGGDGVHVGQEDMTATNARQIIGADKILGVSAQTVEQARLAEKMGADYIGVGAVFPTLSKDDADMVGIEALKTICRSVSVPVVAIGGISGGNIGELRETGICGVAVISAVYGEKDVKKATVALKKLTDEVIKHD